MRLFAQAHKKVENVSIDARSQTAEQWLANAQTPQDRAATVREMLAQDAAHDLSGLDAAYDDERLVFTHHMAIVAGRALRSSQV